MNGVLFPIAEYVLPRDNHDENPATIRVRKRRSGWIDGRA
jgi:hypothetical protein